MSEGLMLSMKFPEISVIRVCPALYSCCRVVSIAIVGDIRNKIKMNIKLFFMFVIRKED
jgi:hypothetical protein